MRRLFLQGLDREDFSMTGKGARDSRLSFNTPRALRQSLEDAAARNDRTLAEEIQARLAITFEIQAMQTGVDGDELLLLRVDHGLMAWLRAYVKAGSLAGDLRATAIWFIRSHLIDSIKYDHIYGSVAKFLPEPIRSHVMNTPKYQAIIDGRGSVSIYRDK